MFPQLDVEIYTLNKLHSFGKMPCCMHLHPCQSALDPQRLARMYLAYCRLESFDIKPLCHSKPQKQNGTNAGGEGATAREVLRHKSVEEVIMVDIDKVHFILVLQNALCKVSLRPYSSRYYSIRRITGCAFSMTAAAAATAMPISHLWLLGWCTSVYGLSTALSKHGLRFGHMSYFRQS